MHLSILRKLSGCFFRIDLFSIHKHFKTPIVKRHKRKLAKALFILGEELFRQTDGFRFIASSGTVFDAQFHAVLLETLLFFPHLPQFLGRDNEEACGFAFSELVGYASTPDMPREETLYGP